MALGRIVAESEPMRPDARAWFRHRTTSATDLGERWMQRQPLVDELLVVDSDSTDDTAAVARAAGADVVATTDVLPAHGTRPGKGEALWKSLAATTGDLVVFLDADLLGDVVHFVPGLLGPLLTDPQVAY